MQLRYETGLTGEQYVTARAWREARLERCPKHPHGGCSLARHGTYERKTPQGVRVARWYCPEKEAVRLVDLRKMDHAGNLASRQRTERLAERRATRPGGNPRQRDRPVGLLPDCLAARLPGTLEVLEAVVVAAEGARSLEAAANEVRPDAIELPGAMRWVRRRVRLVHNALARVIGLIPDRLAGCVATMGAVRDRLKSKRALMELRGLLAEQLQMLPAPLGFQPHGIGVTGRKPAFQQSMGPDPPALSA